MQFTLFGQHPNFNFSCPLHPILALSGRCIRFCFQ